MALSSFAVPTPASIYLLSSQDKPTRMLNDGSIIPYNAALRVALHPTCISEQWDCTARYQTLEALCNDDQYKDIMHETTFQTRIFEPFLRAHVVQTNLPVELTDAARADVGPDLASDSVYIETNSIRLLIGQRSWDQQEMIQAIRERDTQDKMRKAQRRLAQEVAQTSPHAEQNPFSPGNERSLSVPLIGALAEP